MAESSVSTRLTSLRREIRRQNASFQECFDFMKAYGIKPQDETNGESVNAAESLRTLTYLRNELHLFEAVTFLKMYLNWLGENVCENVLYEVEIGFLLGEDLEELLRYSEAQEEYKEILEWISKHGSRKTAEALALSKLAVLVYRLDSKREAKQYYRQCFEILQGVMERKEQSSTPMPEVEMNFAMNAFVTCGEFLRFLGKYDSAKKFFLKALEYCPQNADVVVNRYAIYVELYRNELAINNFVITGPTMLMPTEYDDMTVGHRQLFLRGGNFKNMKEFVRCYSIICVCITIRRFMFNPLSAADLERSSYHPVLLSESQKSLDRNIPSIFMAMKLALCSRFMFESGHLDYRSFKEQAEKHVDGWMAQMNREPPNFVEANLLKSVLFLLLESCIREQNYVDAEKHVRKALELSYTDKPFCGIEALYEEFKADVHFMCACMYYFWRGRTSKVKAFSKLALKYFKKTNNYEKVSVLECLLESLKLPD